MSYIQPLIVNTYAELNSLTVGNGSYATLSTYSIDIATFYPAGLYYKSGDKWHLANPDGATTLAISAFSQTPVTTNGTQPIRGWDSTPGKLVWLNSPSQAGLWLTSNTAWTLQCTLAGMNYNQTLLVTDSLDVGKRYQISVNTALSDRDITLLNTSFIACKFASTPGVKLTLSGIPDKDYTDQVQAEDGDIALVWQQQFDADPAGSENGVFIVNANGAWERHPQFDTWAKLQYMTAVVQYGQQASGYTYYTNIGASGTLGTSFIAIYKSTQNSSIYDETDFGLSSGEIPNNAITSVTCYGYPNPQDNPIRLPTDPVTDDYCIIFHGGGSATTNPLYIFNPNGSNNIDLGNYGGITNLGFVLKNNGFFAKFVYQDYGVKPITFFGDISTANAFIQNIYPPLSDNYLPLQVGQLLEHNAITNFFPAGTTITAIDVTGNKLTVSNNANQTNTSRALNAIVYDYSANPAYVLTEYAYQANEVQGVTYVAINGGSDTFGEINNFGQPYKTIQAGFEDMPSGDQLEIYPNNITGYPAGLTVTNRNAVGTEILAIGDNVVVFGDLNITPFIGYSVSAMIVNGVYWNNLNVVSTDGNIDSIFFKNGGFNATSIDLAGTTGTGFFNNFYFDSCYFIGNFTVFPTGHALQPAPITFYLSNCSWERDGDNATLTINGTQAIVVFQNCLSIPKNIVYANGATSAQVIVNKIPVYNFTKGFNATAITNGALTINNGTNNVSGGLTTNATSITLLKGNTYLVDADITINLSGGATVTLTLALATGDTTSTIYTQSYTTNVNGQHQVNLRAIFQTSYTVNGAVSVVASGITSTVDVLASSSIRVVTYNTGLF